MKERRHAVRRLVFSALPLFLSLTLLITSTFAWFGIIRMLAAYAPISKPESLYIGAGHRDFDPVNMMFTSDHFEDIRYLYFNGIDVNEERDHYDYVFCIFGKAVTSYKLQLAYTTNNQFTYEIFRATESSVYSAAAVAYTTHTDPAETYYYSPSTGVALAGGFLNDQTVGGETIADNTLHGDTSALDPAGTYDNVQKYAEPLYWQTTGAEPGNYRGDFINYYILRVNLNGKTVNDRETDVICIAAKSTSAT